MKLQIDKIQDISKIKDLSISKIKDLCKSENFNHSKDSSNSQRYSSSSVTSLMETKNVFLLIISAIFSLVTGIIILIAGIYSIYNKKYLIIEYDIKLEELVMIPIVFINILHFLIGFSQIYFFIIIKDNSNKKLIAFAFSILNWFYPIIQIIVGLLYLIAVISTQSKLFDILKVANSLVLICMSIIFNDNSINYSCL